MTITQLKELFNYLVDDDNVDDDDVLRLLNIGDQKVHSLRDWEYLGKEDRSESLVAGTTEYDLPSDFMFIKLSGDKTGVERYNAASNSYTDVKIVPFSQRNSYNNQADCAYLDTRQDKLVFTKDPTDQVGDLIVFTYQYQPPEFISGNEDSESPVYPRQWHPLTAYEAAKFYYYNDQPEKDRSWNRELQKEYDTLLEQMVRWDIQLKLADDGEWTPPAYMPIVP